MDTTVSISLPNNVLGKGTNPSVLFPVTGKLYDKLGVFALLW